MDTGSRGIATNQDRKCVNKSIKTTIDERFEEFPDFKMFLLVLYFAMFLFVYQYFVVAHNRIQQL